MKLGEAVAFLSQLHVPQNEAPTVTLNISDAIELALDLAEFSGPHKRLPNDIVNSMMSDDRIVMLCGCRIRAA
jgi:hypothetical protein